MKRSVGWLLLCSLLFTFCACGLPGDTAEGTPPSSQAAENSSAGQNAFALSAEQNRQISEMVLQNAHVISDPYARGEDIPAYSLARFLYERMRADGIADSFERREDNLSVLVPKERVWEYAKLYFDMDTVEVDFYSQQYFDGQFFIIPNPEMNRQEPAYQLSIQKVEARSSRIHVTVSYSSGGVDYQLWTYTLRMREDGSLYFVSMIKRPVEYGLYAVNQASALIDELLDIPVNADTIRNFQFLPFGDQLAVYYFNGRDMRLGILDMTTYKSDQYILVEGSGKESGPFPVQVLGDHIVVYRLDRLTVYDENLLRVQEIPYSSELISLCDSYTAQLYLSPDFHYIAFTNADGLYFFNVQSKNAHLMRNHPSDPSAEGGNPTSLWEPVAFDVGTGRLLGRLTRDGQASSFGLFDIDGGLVSTIRLRTGEDTVLSVQEERLMAFSPVSIVAGSVNRDQEPALKSSIAEYNLSSGVARVEPTGFVVLDEYGELPNQERMLIANRSVFRVSSLEVGKDLVTSWYVQAYQMQGGRLSNLPFGYVDRRGRVRLCAANAQDKVLAACSGMFINTFVVF